VLVNLLNLIDTWQTHICFKTTDCPSEVNPLAHLPVFRYVVKPIVIFIASLIAYLLVRSGPLLPRRACGLALLGVLTFGFTLTVVNNAIVMAGGRGIEPLGAFLERIYSLLRALLERVRPPLSG